MIVGNEGVLVMNMKMPKNCMECFLREKFMCQVERKRVSVSDRPKWCPLIEVYRPKMYKTEEEKGE